MTRLKLHRNVQFIYEKALAELELQAFGIKGFKNKLSTPWDYEINQEFDTDRIINESAYFAKVGRYDSVYRKLITPLFQGGKFNLTRSVNQYLTHWIYPYKGKFHPQMIRAIFNIIGLKKGEIVLDPFSGSGTTVLEATMMGIDSVGVDISPLCVLMGNVKTKAWKYSNEIKDLLHEHSDTSNAPSEIHDFFHLAEMVSHSDASRRNRDYKQSYNRNTEKMHQSISAMAQAQSVVQEGFGNAKLLHGDIRNLHQVASDSIDAVVTSPPYSIALDYVKNDKHALEAMGENLKTIREDFIGVRGKPKDKLELYREDMIIAFKTISRVLKKNKTAVIVIGNATSGKEVMTTDHTIKWAEDAGLRHTKTMPKIVYGLYNLITDEKILFFRKA